jgi:hypothetical protein
VLRAGVLSATHSTLPDNICIGKDCFFVPQPAVPLVSNLIGSGSPYDSEDQRS